MRYVLVTLLFTALILGGGAIAEQREQVDRAKLPLKHPAVVKLRSLPKMRVACVRNMGPYEKTGPAWKKLIEAANKKGLIDKTTDFLGLYYDDPARTPSEKLRCDVCISVDKSVTALEGLTIKDAGGQEYAMAIHIGPHEDLKDTYQLIFEKGLPELRRAYTSGPVIEIYKNDPENTPPNELITEVYVPVKNP
jgi:AraC family transcriptional regulator